MSKKRKRKKNKTKSIPLSIHVSCSIVRHSVNLWPSCLTTRYRLYITVQNLPHLFKREISTIHCNTVSTAAPISLITSDSTTCPNFPSHRFDLRRSAEERSQKSTSDGMHIRGLICDDNARRCVCPLASITPSRSSPSTIIVHRARN